MSFLAINLLLACVWTLLQGVTLFNLVLGFVLGFAVLWVNRPFVGSAGYVAAAMAFVRLTLVFLKELIRANVRVARDVLRRHPRFQPALLRVDVRELGPAQLTLLSAMVSLTPGTVTVDVIEETGSLYMHTMYAHDAVATREEVAGISRLICAATGKGSAARTSTGGPDPAE